MASFQTYPDLLNAVTNWLNRQGDSDVEARIPDWIALGEARIRRQQTWFEQFYSLANAGSPLAVTAHPFELPSYVRDVKTMWNSTSSVQGEIEILTPASWRSFVASNGDAQGVPRKAVIVPHMDAWLVDPDVAGPIVKHGAKVYLWPRPVIDGTWKIDFEFIRDLDPLQANVLNGLYLRHPDLYLYATLCESAPYLQHDERLPLWEARYNQAIAEINVERERAKFSASRKRVQLPVSF